MNNTEVEIDPYELLQLKSEATDAEIKTSYRKLSLKVHPDRNPNNPDAARKFHELNQAYELLLDPLRRLALDAKLRLKQARAQRYAAYDNKRKTMLDELEARERDFKKARVEKDKEEKARFQENERIKEEGRKMREERQKQMEQAEEDRRKAAKDIEEENAPPSLDPHDTIVRLKYSLKSHPTLTNASSIITLMSSFGAIDTDSVAVSLKAPKKDPTKPPKFGSAAVTFKQIGDAFAAVCASGRANDGLDGIEVNWLGGKEPEIIGWLKKMGKLGTPQTGKAKKTKNVDGKQKQAESQQNQPTGLGGFSSFPETFPDPSATSSMPEVVAPGLDYEALTLMRMRQAERERLEREILEQEQNE